MTPRTARAGATPSAGAAGVRGPAPGVVGTRPAPVKEVRPDAENVVVRSPSRARTAGGRRWGSRRVAALAGLVVVPLLALPALVSPAGADEHTPDAASVTGVDRLQEVRRELAGSTEAMVKAVAALREAKDRLPEAEKAAKEARAELAAAEQREAAAAEVRGQAQTRLVVTERAAQQAADAAREREQRLAQLAREAYQHGPESSWVALVGSRSPADLGDRLVLISSAADAQVAAIRELDAAAGSHAARAADLEVARDAFNAAHSTVEREVVAAKQAHDAAQKAQSAVDALVEKRKTALKQAEGEVAEDSRRYAELRASASRLQDALRAKYGVPAGGTVPIRPGTLQSPVSGPITSPYGMRKHPITGVYKLHTGTDFGAACGTPIRAAADGEVLQRGYDTAYGHRVVVTHGVVGGATLTTTYNHQSGITVRAGQRVVRGQVIGYVGTTGYSTGCHLHFELLVGGEFVDPIGWL